MTDDKLDLEELERLEREATPGPWWYDENTDQCSPLIFSGDGRTEPVIAVHPADYDSESWFEVKEVDARFIVALRNAAPKLFERVRELDLQAKDEQAPVPEDSCETGGNYGLCKTHPTCEAVRARIAELERQAQDRDEIHKKAVYCAEHHCDCDQANDVRTLLESRLDARKREGVNG